MKNRRKSLQIQKLKKWDYLLIAIVSVLIFVVMFVFNAQTTRAKRSQVELIENAMAKTSENQKNMFESYVSERIQTLKVIATYPDIYEMDEEKQKNFIQGRSADWGFSHIFVMSMDGVGYYIEEDVHRLQKGEQFYFNVRDNENFIAEPFYTGEGVLLMTACVSIYDGKEKVGSLCGAINLDNVQKLLGENEIILGGDVFILDSKGLYITSKEASDVYNKKPIYETSDSELSLVKEAFSEKTDKQGRIVLNGVEYQSHLTYLDDYNWVIVQNIPVSKITERYAVFNVMQYVLIVFFIILICCIIRIIYSWKKSDRKIYTDSLTKCYSRAACLDLLEYLEENRRQRVGIIYMDLNRFKYVNDTYGHDKGDELLKIFAKVLAKTLGKEGFVGRMGGDEFIAILVDGSEDKIETLWKKVEEELVSASKKLEFDYLISSSYGVAFREKEGKESLNEILQRADKKMYEYKAMRSKQQM